MDFLDIFNISERNIEILNPSSEEKIITLGKYLGLRPGSSILDFGCGYAEPLKLWAQTYGIGGIGVDVRPHACERATNKLKAAGLSEQIQIVCSEGAKLEYAPNSFDAVTCIGASFIWGGFRDALQAMKPALKEGGRIGIGEPYWISGNVPEVYAAQYPGFYTECQILQIIREEGFELGYLVRASHEDWDRYEGGNWDGILQWLKENSDHPDREQVMNHMRTDQDNYLNYGREFLGWSMYVLYSI